MMKSNFSKWIGILACTTSFAHAAAPANGEPLEILQDLLNKKDVISDLTAMDKQGLTQGKTAEQPWSHQYWPDIKGGISFQYANPDNSVHLLFGYGLNRSSFFASHDEIVKNIFSLSEEEIAEKLSPSEKYDLLIGDLDFSLTKAIWKNIDFRHEYKYNWKEMRWGEQRGMALWIGICNGWSAAAVSLPRPKHSFVVTGNLGHRIKFYPDDIMALASHLWARTFANNAVKSAGLRCSIRVKRDENGRPVDLECRDINPAVWHLAVVNKIGVSKKGFVIDKSQKAGVANHPVSGYKYGFFHPLTGKKGMLSESTYAIPATNEKDKFRTYRSPKARYLVGVDMDLEYLRNMQGSSTKETNSESDDLIGTMTLQYDLELDENMKVVGGEWRRKGLNHAIRFRSAQADFPDFLWIVPDNLKAWSTASNEAIDGSFDAKGNWVPAWSGTGAIPKDWVDASIKSTNELGLKGLKGEEYAFPAPGQPLAQPLAELVDALIALSRK